MMGAHSVATLAAAEQRLAYVLRRLNARSEWHALLSAALAEPERGGSLKRWIEEGMELRTLQLDVHLENGAPAGIGNVWVPDARIVDGVAATYFTQNGSRRDFKGVTTLLQRQNLYIGFSSDSRGDRIGLIVYRVLS